MVKQNKLLKSSGKIWTPQVELTYYGIILLKKMLILDAARCNKQQLV